MNIFGVKTWQSKRFGEPNENTELGAVFRTRLESDPEEELITYIPTEFLGFSDEGDIYEIHWKFLIKPSLEEALHYCLNDDPDMLICI